HRPVAGIDLACGRVAQWSGLRLHAGVLQRRDLTGPEPAVVAETIDIDAIVVRIRVDLEVDRLAVIEADLCGEALDIAVPGPAQAPLGNRISGLLVLQHDGVGDGRRRRRDQGRRFYPRRNRLRRGEGRGLLRLRAGYG